ncbi:hypothetical protein CASFOL_001886 [Castilleja foliolosa]|uniref:Proline-rich protein n=1 Tax=Castilleja foliolosa TaxID=1961234 RepID=A0ABD3ECV7_9LAMI
MKPALLVVIYFFFFNAIMLTHCVRNPSVNYNIFANHKYYEVERDGDPRRPSEPVASTPQRRSMPPPELQSPPPPSPLY